MNKHTTSTAIANNCKKATFLIEKKQAGKITLQEKLELKLHLAGCSLCRIYRQQSLIINKMLKKIVIKPGEPKVKLDDDYKKQLQDKIESTLKRK